MRRSDPIIDFDTSDGSVSDDNSKELFPVSTGNQVKFYSNAYEVNAGGDARHHSQGAFADMFRDMNAARSHICIVGWALSSTEKFGENDDCLPELLVRKALEGVKVIVLIWDNIVPMYNRDHKRITQVIKSQILQHSPEAQAVIRRNLSFKFTPREIGYSDHQKMVVVDSALYIGGLDLVDGRSDPDTWHDSHARVEGEAVLSAIDLIHARWDGAEQDSHRDRWVSEQLSDIRTAVQMQARKTSTVNLHKTMQLLCSGRERYWGKDHSWSTSSHKQSRTQEIHQAYIGAIQRAERFIYMENQFFIGNRLHKNKVDTVESSNQVIAAIVNKIRDKIQKGEDFHFYCQLPFRPDSDLKSYGLILRKEWKTIEWVIKVVDDAAKPHGKSAADFLTFYNLGREVYGQYEMKYTHSKLMIVDDRELILGSANCNERSMSGSRDSEVAVHMSGYEMEITNYRERLLSEHFGDEFVSANAMLLIKDAGGRDGSRLLQLRLSENLNLLGTMQKPVATPWGNVPITHLMERRRPGHVMRRTPLSFNAVMGVVKWAKKLPL
jgi:phospholipase D1/2